MVPELSLEGGRFCCGLRGFQPALVPERSKWDNQERVIKESQERLFRIIKRVLLFLRSRAAT